MDNEHADGIFDTGYIIVTVVFILFANLLAVIVSYDGRKRRLNNGSKFCVTIVIWTMPPAVDT